MIFAFFCVLTLQQLYFVYPALFDDVWPLSLVRAALFLLPWPPLTPLDVIGAVQLPLASLLAAVDVLG